MNGSDFRKEKSAGTGTEEMRSIADLMTELKTSAAGLSEGEAKQRLTRFGFNELPEKKRNPFLEFLSRFQGPIPWMVEAAATLSGANDRVKAGGVSDFQQKSSCVIIITALDLKLK